MMAYIDALLNTWVSCDQTAGLGIRVGHIRKGFLHIVTNDLNDECIYVISFNKRNNPSAKRGFSEYKHPVGLPCGWSLGNKGAQCFANMKPLSPVKLGEI